MQSQHQQRQLYQTKQLQAQYLWIKNNEYRKIFSGFVHDQNFKIRLGVENQNSIYKIQQKLHATNTGKSYQISGDFQTWNLLSFQTNKLPLTLNKPFTKRLLQQQSLLIGTSRNHIKIQWRAGQRQYKKFLFNPFISFQTHKKLQDLHVTLGLIHKSQHVNLISKLNAAILHSLDINSNTRFQYAKNQIYFGLVTEYMNGFNCKINRSLLGYQLSQNDYFYLKFQTDNLGDLVKGKQVSQEIGFYYLKKMNEKLKFALGVRSVNSTQNTLNLVVETKAPFDIKGKIDSKLNVHVTAKKQINEHSAISYGIGLTNLFQKKFRLQTGLVYEFNT